MLLRPQGTIAHQAPLSMRFPRQEYWGRLPFPSPGDLPDPGIKPHITCIASGFFTAEPLEGVDAWVQIVAVTLTVIFSNSPTSLHQFPQSVFKLHRASTKQCCYCGIFLSICWFQKVHFSVPNLMPPPFFCLHHMACGILVPWTRDGIWSSTKQNYCEWLSLGSRLFCLLFLICHRWRQYISW